MTSREKIRGILERRNAEGAGFWTGNPTDETVELYLAELGLGDREALYRYLQDDIRWVPADHFYAPSPQRPMFDPCGGRERVTLSQPGIFADCDSLQEIEDHPWPDPADMDTDALVQAVESCGDRAVFTGMWSPFFHIVADYLGMDNYFVKMYTHPDVVAAVTRKVVDFTVEANRRCFEALGDRADTFFFGNDFGTQLDLLISPEAFREFILPSFRRLIASARNMGRLVVLHSCGSVYRVIPDLIEAGIDGLHPLQALAANMDAERLAREFGTAIAFIGGVDTQQLLIHATPAEIRTEVHRLCGVLGPNFVVSPSHEAILPNVPAANVVAMAEAAREAAGEGAA